MSPEPFLTGAQLAEVLGVSRTSVYRMTKDGLPSYVFCKRSRRYRESECVAWLRGRGSVRGADVIQLRPRRSTR